MSNPKPTSSIIYISLHYPVHNTLLGSLISGSSMGKSLCLSLCFLVLFHGCICIAQQQQERQQNKCRISRLSAQEPSNRIQSEAGVTEIYDHNNQQLQCAGVAVVRYIIKPRGLLLPSYLNAPQLMYFIQGEALNLIATKQG